MSFFFGGGTSVGQRAVSRLWVSPSTTGSRNQMHVVRLVGQVLLPLSHLADFRNYFKANSFTCSTFLFFSRKGTKIETSNSDVFCMIKLPTQMKALQISYIMVYKPRYIPFPPTKAFSRVA